MLPNLSKVGTPLESCYLKIIILWKYCILIKYKTDEELKITYKEYYESSNLIMVYRRDVSPTHRIIFFAAIVFFLKYLNLGNFS